MRAFTSIAAAVCTVLASVVALGARQAAAPLFSPGERLYLKGLSVSGTPIPATVQGDLRVRSTDMPCSNCHRRSGWGTSEGPVTTPALVGPVLFQPVTRGAAQIGTRTTGAGTRPAYDDETLLRALRDGVDPAGRTLSPTMPRYTMTPADVAALSAHLRTLSAEPPPGVTESTIHFATIIGPDVSVARRDSVLDILRAFVRAKNAGSRHETRRRERGPWDMKEQYQLYRQWNVHEWQLTGSPREWGAQLEALYRKQPVFAVLGGLVDDDWSPIDEFCVRHGIPQVLPQTPQPPVRSADPFFGLFFSRGVAADAEKLARELGSANSARRIVQVSRCGSAGAVAAAAFSRESPLSLRAKSECFPATGSLNGDAWRDLLQDGTDTLVAWLDERDISGLEMLASREDLLAKIKDVYVSSALLGERATRLPAAIAAKASIVHPFVAPQEFDQYAWRTLTWFKTNQLTPADRWLAANTFFAATLAGDALAMPRTLASRELFIERMEHMAGRSPQRSAYTSVSFDATHHFGSAAFRVIKLPAPAGGSSAKVER